MNNHKDKWEKEYEIMIVGKDGFDFSFVRRVIALNKKDASRIALRLMLPITAKKLKIASIKRISIWE